MKKKIMILFIVILGLLCIGIGYLVLSYSKEKDNNNVLPEPSPTEEASNPGQDIVEDSQTILESFGLIATKGVSVNLRLTEVNMNGTYRILALIYNHENIPVSYNGIGFDVMNDAGQYIDSCTVQEEIQLNYNEYKILECDFQTTEKLAIENIHYHIINSIS